MNAFVPTSLAPNPLRTTAFSGTPVQRPVRPNTHATAPCPLASRTRAVPVAEVAVLDMEKYANMSAPPPEAPPLAPSTLNSGWTAYLNTVKERCFPYYGSKHIDRSNTRSAAAIAAASTPYARILTAIKNRGFGKGGDPDTMINKGLFLAADRYMSKCVNMQYKMTAVPNGVYSIRCTEGTYRGQAEESRIASLASQFRLNQRSTAHKFGDYTEIRRKAIIACAGCSYEEKLVDLYPISARSVVTGGSEAKGVCVRYAVASSPAEHFMASSVDKQSKFRAVPFGVYDVLCNDGSTKFMAEHKRVSSLAARFRAGQLPPVTKEQVKFDSAKYARDSFGHGCDYEENLFNKFPAVAASMRPNSARY